MSPPSPFSNLQPNMPPWVDVPVMEVDLEQPLAEQFARFPPPVFEQGRKLLAAVMGEIPRSARMLADLVRLRTGNRFQREAVLLARQVGASWRDVMLANMSYDLVLATIGCSTVALPTASGPVLARNMDWWPEDVLAQASCLTLFHRGADLAFANAGWPGSIGVVTGLSGRGFAVALNAVSCPERVAKTGYPVLLGIRRVVEDARDFDEAVKMLSRTRFIAPSLFTVAGLENGQRVVIERTPRRHALRWAEPDRPLFATNDYRLLFRPETSDTAEIYQTTCSRYDALCRHFAGHDPAEGRTPTLCADQRRRHTTNHGATHHSPPAPRAGSAMGAAAVAGRGTDTIQMSCLTTRPRLMGH